MVLTVDPRAYRNGIVGDWIEDVILTTADGAEDRSEFSLEPLVWDTWWRGPGCHECRWRCLGRSGRCGKREGSDVVWSDEGSLFADHQVVVGCYPPTAG